MSTNSETMWSRRRFLGTLAAAGVASLTAPVRGFCQVPAKKTKLGFDNFSIRAFN